MDLPRLLRFDVDGGSEEGDAERHDDDDGAPHVYRRPHRRNVCAAVTSSASAGYVPTPAGPLVASTKTHRTMP